MTSSTTTRDLPTTNSLPLLADLQQQVANCTQCLLAETRKQTVFADGNPHARIVIIGEAPGASEDDTGLPFVGRSGKLLTSFIEAAGFNRQQHVYICNVVKCRPPENRPPKPAERTTCKPYLDQQLALIQPDMILLAGATALKAVMGIPSGITKLRGQWMDSPYVGKHGQPVKAMAIFHPSYLLRNPSEKPGSPKALMHSDIQEVRRVYDALEANQPYDAAFTQS